MLRMQLERNDVQKKIRVKFWGDIGCFTRPEFKGERVSYEVMTPSAARGAIESILWKPAVYWIVHRIHVLRPIRFMSFQRNEVKDRAPVAKLMRDAAQGKMEPFLADKRHTPRHTLALRDLAYVIEVSPRLTARAERGETPQKFAEMLERRVQHGQCFQQPAFGCREFVAQFGPDDGEPPIALTRNLGVMLHDVEYCQDAPTQPHFFHAQLSNGVLTVPPPSWIVSAA